MCSVPGWAKEIQPTYIQLGFWDSFELFPSSYSVNGLRLDFFKGVNDNVQGIDFGVINKSNSGGGFEFGALNFSEDYKGLQLGVLANIVSSGEGVEVGMYNSAKEQMHGLQVGLINIAGALDGVQIGIFNYNDNIPGRFSPFVYFKF